MKHTLSQSNVTTESRSLSDGLCAAIETLSGSRRERAEERLLRTVNWVSQHAPDVTFVRSGGCEVAHSDFEVAGVDFP